MQNSDKLYHNAPDDFFANISEEDITEDNTTILPDYNDKNTFKFILKMSAKNNINEIQLLSKALDKRLSVLPDSMKYTSNVMIDEADRVMISPDKKRIAFHISFTLSISEPSLNDIEILRKIMNFKISKLDSKINSLNVYRICGDVCNHTVEANAHFIKDTTDELFGSKYETTIYAQLCEGLSFGKITLGMIYHKFNPHYLNYSIYRPGYVGAELIDCHKFITQEYHRKCYNINDIPLEICDAITAESICSAMDYAITLQEKYQNNSEIHYMHSFHIKAFQIDYTEISSCYYNHTVSLVSPENEAFIQAKSHAEELMKYRLKTPHRYIAKTVGSDVALSFSLGDYLSNNESKSYLFTIILYFNIPKTDADDFFRILFSNKIFKY